MSLHVPSGCQCMARGGTPWHTQREKGEETHPPRKAPTGFLTRATGAAGGSGRGSGSRMGSGRLDAWALAGEGSREGVGAVAEA